jgi:hypothetical protein
MKQSVKCIWVIFFVMMFAITSTTFGADTSGSGPSGAAGAKLPSAIKINPDDIGGMLINYQPQQVKGQLYKTQVKKTYDLAKILSDQRVPEMENAIVAMNQKVEECKNKTYTTADMTAAGCTDNMTIAACSKILFNKCIYQKTAYADEIRRSIIREIEYLKSYQESLSSLFPEWIPPISYGGSQ